MGVLTYSQMKDRLKFELGNRTSLETPTDWYGTLINEAYSMLCLRTRLFNIPFRIWLPELETSYALTTTDGTPYVSLPTDCFIVRAIWDSDNDVILRWITPEDYYSRTGRANSGAKSTPREYTRLGTKLYLYPTPDATYNETCYYKKYPSGLSQDNDVTEIGREWDVPIIKLATIISLYKLKEYDFAEIEKKNFQEDIMGLVNAFAQEQRQMDKHLQPNSMYLQRGVV